MERTFYCVECGEQIERKGRSGRPRYCPTHREEAGRRAARRAELKRQGKRRTPSKGPRATVTHCFYCGGKFAKPRGKCQHPARCRRCRLDYVNGQQRAKRHRKATTACMDCGATVPQKRKGPKDTRCAGCRASRRREQQRIIARVYYHVRRARKRGSLAEKFHAAEIFDRDGWRCGICGRRIRAELRHPHPMSASIDHKVPLAAGGEHTRRNVQAAHLRCNVRKRDKVENIQMALFG